MSNMDGKQFWSEETYTLRNVVYDIGLPTVVKVSEGIYNDNEVETFSCGDLIKLDFQKSITKVSAQFLDEQTMSESIVDEFGYHLLKEEILIPLDYRGRVTVMQPQGRKNRFYSVKELANTFPKHVRVDKPIKVYADNRTVKLKPGAILELDRVLPSVGLVCRLDGKDIMLNLKQKGKFTQTASDDTTYSLKEIVDNFPLPQYVKILDKEFQKMATEDLDDVLGNFKKFCGLMKIQSVVKQSVVIGHHRSLKKCRKIHCERPIALFPLDNLSVTGILVHVPLYTEPDDYQLILAKNFSKTLDETDGVDGVIYLEFAKNTRPRILNTTRRQKTPFSTILPPPRSNKTTYNYNEEEDIYEDAITPAKPNYDQRAENTNRCSDWSTTIDDTYLEPRHLARENRHSYLTPLSWNRSKYENVFEPIASVFGSSIKTSNKDLRTFLPSPILMRHTAPPRTGSDMPFKPRPKMPLPPLPDKERKKLHVLSPKLPRRTEVRHEPLNRTVSEFLDTDRNRRQLSSTRRDRIPSAIVRPHTQTNINFTPRPFHSLTVKELASSLKQCGMAKLAKTCETEFLDGAFINGLSIKELATSPFTLTPVEMKKIEKMKEGWRPNRKV